MRTQTTHPARHRSGAKPLLSIIIVTWNSAADIRVCLNSIKSSVRSVPHEVFVIDNVSSDNTVSLIAKHYPWVKLLPQKKNWGFGEGNNIGLKDAKGKYILLLNPDTKINRLAIKTMVTFLDTHEKAGAVGPEQFNAKGKTIFMMSRYSLRGILEFIIEKAISIIRNKTIILFRKPYKTNRLNAGCVMARADLLPSRQWFDPEYFIYGEEQHLFKQIHAARWDVYFLRNCSIFHYREKSIAQTGKKWKYAVDSFMTSARKLHFIQRLRHQTTNR